MEPLSHDELCRRLLDRLKSFPSECATLNPRDHQHGALIWIGETYYETPWGDHLHSGWMFIGMDGKYHRKAQWIGGGDVANEELTFLIENHFAAPEPMQLEVP
jgi:hypothetical protein